jgi:uncharacterized protein (DUF1330 family)
MAKGYWVSCYRSVADEAALANYVAEAGPVITAQGGRFLARGWADRAYEAGFAQRLVIVEFDSLDAAIAAYESPQYQAVLALLDGVAERDVRIIAGV